MRRLKRFKAMMLLIFLTHVFQLTLADVTPIADSCKSTPVQDPLVQGRASSVKFPNGRVVTVVGHVHGPRQFSKFVDLYDSGRLAEISNEEFEELLLGTLKENEKPEKSLSINSNRRSAQAALSQRFGNEVGQSINTKNGFDLTNVTVLNHAEQDYNYLMKKLANAKDEIQFVGYEGTMETSRHNYYKSLQVQNALLDEVSRRKTKGWKGPSWMQMEKILMSSSNGSVYAYMKTPELILRIPRVGVESEAVTEEYSRRDPLKKMYNDLRVWVAATNTLPEAQLNRLSQDRKFLGYVSLVTTLFSAVQNMELTTIEELDSRIQFLRSYDYPWTRSAQEDLLASLRQRLLLNLSRDRASAENLSAQNSSGIHFVGLNHYRNTIQNLEILCSLELVQGRAPKYRLYSGSISTK